jgi:Holliday junction resolvase RusA-like endonuclease
VTAVEFTVAGRPVPWARTRTNGRRRFTPAKQRDHAAAVAAAAEAYRRAARLPVPVWTVAPLHVHVSFRYQVPKRGAAGAAVGDPRPGRPDIDNLLKLVLDALNGVVWADDAQVVSITATKVYAAQPGTYVRVNPVPHGRLRP